MSAMVPGRLLSICFGLQKKNRTSFLVVLDGKRELEKEQTALALHIEIFWMASFSSFAHIILACLISKTISKKTLNIFTSVL